MATLQFLNGRRYSHSSLEITLYKRKVNVSEIFIDIDSIEYGDSLDMGDIAGTNRALLGVTAGDYRAKDVAISMGKSTFQNGIVDAIGEGWLGSELGLTVSYNDDGEPLTVDVIRCFIIGAEDSSSAGPDGVKVKMPCKAVWVSRNNIMPIPGIFQ
jgi:hypothetical protein